MNLTGNKQVIGVEIRGDGASVSRALSQTQAEIDKFSRDAGKGFASAQQSAGKSLDGIDKSLGETEKATSRSGKEIDKWSRETSEGFKNAEHSVGGFVGSLGRLAGVTGMAVLVKQIGQVGVGFHDFTEKAELSFNTLLGSVGESRAFLADVLEFAKQTPHSFPDLTEQAQQMLGMGIEVEKVIPALRAAGDAAAGMGKGLDTVRLFGDVLGTIASTGHITGREIQRLSQQGVPALKILANEAGVTAEVMRKDISEGAVEANWAIDTLVKGLDEGTVGVNGATQAFGGLMEAVKESGGWTATLDSAKSSFRNMSAALTDSLMPAMKGTLVVGTDLMGWVRGAADAFNALPGPLQLGIAGLIGLRIALTGTRRQATLAALGLTSLSASATTIQARAAGLGLQLNRTQAHVLALGRSAATAGRSLLGAFGGPVGILLTGTALGVAAINKSLQDTRDQIGELAAKANVFEPGVFDAAISEIEELRDAIMEGGEEKPWWDRIGVGDFSLGNYKDYSNITDANEAIAELNSNAANTTVNLTKVAQETGIAFDEVKKFASESGIDLSMAMGTEEAQVNVQKLTEMIVESNLRAQDALIGWQQFTNEQRKAIDQAGEAASKAFDASFNLVKTFKEVIITEEDYAAAQEKVDAALRSVKDSEAALKREQDKNKPDADARVRAEEKIIDAKKKHAQAVQDLQDLQKADKPIHTQLEDHYRTTLENAETFASQINDVIQAGLDPVLVAELILAGPEQAGPQLEAMLGEHGSTLIGMANETYEIMEGLNTQITESARLTAMALAAPTSELADELPLAMRIAAERETSQTVDEIAKKLGEEPDKIRRVGEMFGMEWVKGFETAFDGMQIRIKNGQVTLGTEGYRVPGFYTGGIYPGYTPGRDIGLIGVSGGEAIMRPEWTRAVGPDWIHKMNALARTGGVNAIRQAMAPFLGGFAMGGTVPSSPQVVTVPVTSRHESHSPISVANLYVNDASDFMNTITERRANNSLVGRG